MRKLLYAILAFCFISLACIYIFIPSQIIVSKAGQVESSERIIANQLNYSKTRRAWWPEKKANNSSGIDSSVLSCQGFRYSFKTTNFNSAEVLISDGNFKSNGKIIWEAFPKNIIKVAWITSIQASNNPIKRFLQYRQALKVKANMGLIIEGLFNYVVNSENIYGSKIERQTVQDTLLATSTMISQTYPETRQVYHLIQSVRTYTEKQEVRQVNPPMINTWENEQGYYQTMVAIPINKEITPDSKVLVKRMVAGNILVAEIKGGPHAIAEGFIQMKSYMQDFKLSSPAIPFQSLITDRSVEKDTSKWITKIYYPIL